jgi:hypothetical protein
MSQKNEKGRINIYVPRQLWRRVKLAAAARDLSVSEFCARAIEASLEEADRMQPSDSLDGDAVLAARRFREAHFGRSVLRVSTAELLRQARENADER